MAGNPGDAVICRVLRTQCAGPAPATRGGLPAPAGPQAGKTQDLSPVTTNRPPPAASAHTAARRDSHYPSGPPFVRARVTPARRRQPSPTWTSLLPGCPERRRASELERYPATWSAWPAPAGPAGRGPRPAPQAPARGTARTMTDQQLAAGNAVDHSRGLAVPDSGRDVPGRPDPAQAGGQAAAQPPESRSAVCSPDEACTRVAASPLAARYRAFHLPTWH
jgi:hypothetical protein